MTIFYSYQDRRREAAGYRRKFARVRRATARLGAAFRMIHDAIVAAKLRRLERELTFHEVPQRPLILDDKWDF